MLVRNLGLSVPVRTLIEVSEWGFSMRWGLSLVFASLMLRSISLAIFKATECQKTVIQWYKSSFELLFSRKESFLGVSLMGKPLSS